MGHRIFFEAVDSTNGFQSGVLTELDKRIALDKVLMTVKTDGSDTYEGDKYITVNYDICEHNRYDEIVDMNSLIPLDAGLINAMKPYELTAIRLLIRNYERDIYTMDESMRYYLKHLRFWNHQLVENKIDFVFFTCTPHHTHDYVIYALAQVLGIKTCVTISTNLASRSFLAKKLDTAHRETYELYIRKYKDMEPDRVTLPEDVETYYNTIREGSREKMRTQALQGFSLSEELKEKRGLFVTDLSLKRIIRKNLSDLKHHVLGARDEAEKSRALEAIRLRWALHKRDRIKQHFMRGIDYYDSLAKAPDYRDKYVIYFLHYQPEATTLPQGGVFHDQELALSIMAEATAKLGIKLYVKEHFVQYRRMKTFYDDIAKIPNITLIKTEYNSGDLIDNSYCGATGNGTVVLESVIRGKPMIIFGETGFASCPGVHKVGCVEAAVAALRQVDSERKEGISQRDVRAYLAAFAENSIYSEVYNFDGLKRGDPGYDISMENTVDVICRKIKE